jgi:hypothetical protein
MQLPKDRSIEARQLNQHRQLSAVIPQDAARRSTAQHRHTHFDLTVTAEVLCCHTEAPCCCTALTMKGAAAAAVALAFTPSTALVHGPTRPQSCAAVRPRSYNVRMVVGSKQSSVAEDSERSMSGGSSRSIKGSSSSRLQSKRGIDFSESSNQFSSQAWLTLVPDIASTSSTESSQQSQTKLYDASGAYSTIVSPSPQAVSYDCYLHPSDTIHY